jgi:ADP-heptose:LPS heptosyltransferase
MSVTSDVLTWLSGARRRIGPASLNGRNNHTAYFYNAKKDLDWRRDPTRHQTQRNLDIASILVPEVVSLELEIGLSDEEIRRAGEQLAHARLDDTLIVGFHPGAAKTENRWDALRFAEIANRCAEIFGGIHRDYRGTG